MKVVVFSDLHLDYSQDRPKRLSAGVAVGKHIIAKAIEIGADVLFCGDLVHSPRQDTRVICAFIRALQPLAWRNTKDYIKSQTVIFSVAGNHDQSGKNTLDFPVPHALDLLNDVSFDPNSSGEAAIVWQDLTQDVPLSQTNQIALGHIFQPHANTKETNEATVYAIPYYEDAASLVRHLEILNEHILEYADYLPSKRRLLMLHTTPFELGAIFNGQISATDPLFACFDFVFCGHIHKHQMITPNWAIVGSPMETRADEAGYTTGYLIYDTDTNTCEHMSTVGMSPVYTSDSTIAEVGYFRAVYEHKVVESKASKYLTLTEPQDLLATYIAEQETDTEIQNRAISMAAKLL